MPNWVFNTVTVTGTEPQLDDLADRLRGENGSLFSFQSVLPRPADKDDNWYDWNCEHWSTKWDASDPRLERVSATELVYRFDTAWSPPEGVMRALTAQFPELVFRHEFIEEQGWGGIVELSAGEFSLVDEWDVPSSHAEMVHRQGHCWCADGDLGVFTDCLSARAAEAGLEPEELRTASVLAAGWDEGLEALIATSRVL